MELKQLTNVTKPVVTGDAVTGSVMKVSAGTWSVPSDKLTFTYNWFARTGRKRSAARGSPRTRPKLARPSPSS